MLQHKPTEQQVREIIESAVTCEHQFVEDALPNDLLGMNAESMKNYVEFVADRLMVALGFNKIYNVANPFPWMQMISLQGKANFFEKRVAEYQTSGLMHLLSLREKLLNRRTLKFDEPF